MGFFLWNSKLDGANPFSYHSGPMWTSRPDPYQDFDNRFVKGRSGAYKDHMVTLPSKEGPIPTLNYEAMREGIDDLRYLELLDKLISELEANGDNRSTDYRTRFNQRLTPFMDVEHYKEFTPQMFDQVRSEVITDILSLQ